MEHARPTRHWRWFVAGIACGVTLSITVWLIWRQNALGIRDTQRTHPTEFLVGVAGMAEHEALALIGDRMIAEACRRMGVAADARTAKREGTADRGYYRIDCGNSLLRLTTNADRIVTEADCISR